MWYTTNLTRAVWSLAVVGLLSTGLVLPAMARQERLPPPEEPSGNIEPLVRGPIHEAFGQPQTFKPETGLIVPKKPPVPINESPPDQKPAGENVVWISGYWSWDPGSQDYLWVSGFWRQAPPERQWIPGYWTRTEDGYQWVSGYWGPATQQDNSYLPAPPDSLEVGPSTDPPEVDFVWSPGSWRWSSGRYLWRPGFWVAPRPNWCWVPATYFWTPRGCVFVDGYWDYPFANRGLLYCPVRFTAGVCFRPGFCYTPAVCLDTSIVFDYLFCWPRYHHYCFGDFYAGSWSGSGIYPWYSFGRSRFGWDPVFAFERSRHVHDPRWSQNLATNLNFRREHAEARPPLTFAAQQRLLAGGRLTGAQRLARPVSEFANSNTGLRLERVTRDRQQQALTHSGELRHLQSDRVARETHATGNAVSHLAGAANISLPKTSPVVRSDLPRTGEHTGPPSVAPHRDVIGNDGPGRELPRRQAIPQVQQTMHPPTRSPAMSVPPAQPQVNRSIERGQSHGDASHNAGARQRSTGASPNAAHGAMAHQSHHVTTQYRAHAAPSRSRPAASNAMHHAATTTREKQKK